MKNIIFYSSIVLFFLASCNRFNNTKDGKVDFSNDTVFFDTIFSQIGSTTKQLMIYNNNDYPVKIDKMYLAEGNNSKYRINIDGYASNSIKDIIIDKKDSMFVFVEVTIDPGTDYLIEEDSIIIQSGDKSQSVLLYAVGRDVHLISGEILETQTWTNDKPYLIYNSILVDTLQTLTIEPGVEIYSHRFSAIYVKGTLVADGTKEAPIVMKGDRIDELEFYENKPGQWSGLYFLRGSNNNYLNYVTINESTAGVYVDSMLNDNYPTVFINNSKIMNCSYMGIFGYKTYITVLNSVIADCNVNNIALFVSGIYNFYHCTISNYYSFSPRNSTAVGIQNFLLNQEGNRIIDSGFISTIFSNCIIYGNQSNEFVANAYKPNSLALLVQNCLVKVDTADIDTSASFFQNLVANKEPRFKDLDKYDFNLKDSSAAINKANYETDNLNSALLRFDMNGTDRLIDQKPDIGAFEYIVE